MIGLVPFGHYWPVASVDTSLVGLVSLRIGCLARFAVAEQFVGSWCPLGIIRPWDH